MHYLIQSSDTQVVDKALRKKSKADEESSFLRKKGVISIIKGHDGVSPSGKAAVFGTATRRFESFHPNLFSCKSSFADISMKIMLSLVTTFLFCFSLHGSVVIEECFSIEQLLSLARPSTSQLILLDIDNTLLHPRQMLGSDEWFSYYLEQQQTLSPNKEEAFHRVLDLWHSIHTVSSVIPMEKKTADIVKALQNMNCAVMAFTTRGSMLQHVTVRQLSSLGLDFRFASPVRATFTLQRTPSVLFSQGILFTNGTHKGESLREFLGQIGWFPDQIIFLNDKKSQLEEASSKLPPHVAFLGLRYAVSDSFVARFNPRIAERQLRHFLHIQEDLVGNETSLIHQE